MNKFLLPFNYKQTIIILLLIFCFNYTYAQSNICYTDITNGVKLSNKNALNNYTSHDFSKLWLNTDNQSVYGVIGDNYQRIFIKFLKIEKDVERNDKYFVYGKSCVKGNVCSFKGNIIITNIQEYENISYGVDNLYQDSAIQKQCLLSAQYEFQEDKNGNHAGIFSGILQSKFYIDRNGNARYDDIEIASDSYFNNAFVGIWRPYNSSNQKICNWGDYRVPSSKCDFDMGAGEFSVSEKYINQGWHDIFLKENEDWWK